MKASILIPWRATDIDRVSSLRALLVELAKQARGVIGVSFDVHIHVNGPGAHAAIVSLRDELPPGMPVKISSSSISDKIAAVRVGANSALIAGCDVLVVVDNDVQLEPGSLEAMLAAFRASCAQAVFATKAPFTTKSSSEFQLVYSYAVQESFQHRLFPKRPTGSFYAIEPAVVHLILISGLAEGDMLARIGAEDCGVVVRSAYARDFVSETDRRIRHWRASEQNGFIRLHSHQGFSLEAASITLPQSVDRDRFMQSIDLWAQIHETAARLAPLSDPRYLDVGRV